MDFWINLFHEIKASSVLELACGTGRLAELFLREGATYSGIDINQDFVRSAKQKLKKYSSKISILNEDMRTFDLNKKFDFIFIGFNSFLHLLTDDDVSLFFASVKKHMHENSHFIIDIYIPDPLFLYRPENYKFPVLEYTDSITKKHIFVEESNEYDSKTEINKLTWFFSTNKKRDFDIRTFSVRMYFPSKMNQLLIDAGFNILNQWGDYYRTDLNVGSKLQIYNTQISK